MKPIKPIILGALAVLFMASCGNKTDKPPVDLKSNNKLEIPYTEQGGVKIIPVKLNGSEMKMILDTGCSGISISLHEVQTLAKNHELDPSDILGTSYSRIANGEIVENVEVRLREVEIGGKDGITLKNVNASVVLNQEAPLLLGNTVLDEVKSIEVDNVKKVIRFKRK